jgi:hypothetical protein
MRTRVLGILASLLLVGCQGAQQPAVESDVPLVHDVGAVHREITTSSPDAQLWFDRGLGLAYGFNSPASSARSRPTPTAPCAGGARPTRWERC